MPASLAYSTAHGTHTDPRTRGNEMGSSGFKEVMQSAQDVTGPGLSDSRACTLDLDTKLHPGRALSLSLQHRGSKPRAHVSPKWIPTWSMGGEGVSLTRA